MGSWGTGIFDDDTALDIKTEYDGLLAYFTDEEAEKRILEDFGECLDTDEEPVFWFALALSEWKKGRLSEHVKRKAIEWIDSGEDLAVWAESGEKEYNKRKAELEKLRATLLTAQPARKAVRRPVPARSPWREGDLLAHRITGGGPEAAELSGKYVLLRVIEIRRKQLARYTQDYGESIILGLYNWHGDAIPEPGIVKNLKYIPVVDYTGESGHRNTIMYLYWYMPGKSELKKVDIVYLGGGSGADTEVRTAHDTRVNCQVSAAGFDYPICHALRLAGLT